VSAEAPEEPQSLSLHASCVALGAAGILLTGGPGSGKSTEALRLIALGAELVADDQVILTAGPKGIVAAPPEATAGLIEARGVGLLRMPFRSEVQLSLVVDLDTIEARRLPIQHEAEILETSLPMILGKNLPDLAAVLHAWFGAGGAREAP
jgi:HPr kinase/phosphorylase